MIYFAAQTSNESVPPSVGEGVEEMALGGQEELPTPPKTSKPLLAAVLLIIVFGLIMFTVINQALGTYEMVNGTGKTPLEGLVEDGDGDPVEGVAVTIEDTDLIVYTNSLGEYEIPEAPSGEQTVKFYKDGHRVIIVHTMLYSKDILERNNWDANVIDIPDWVPGGSWSGALKGPYIEVSTNPQENGKVSGIVEDAGDKPLSNVKINVTGTLLSTTTDEGGHYEFTNLTPGRYELNAVNITSTGTETIRVISVVTAQDHQTINLKFDATTVNTTIDLTAGKFGEVTGRVVDENDEPLPDAKVQIVNSDIEIDGVNITYTDQSGNFRFDDIPIGIYDLAAVAENYYINKSLNLTVEHNGIVNENFTLKSISSPREVTADLAVIYYCLVIFAIIAIIALLGGISAYRRKRYGLAFAGAVVGIIPAILMNTELCICGSAILSVLALMLLVLAKNEFQLPPVE